MVSLMPTLEVLVGGALLAVLLHTLVNSMTMPRLTAVPGRIGHTTRFFTRDAYGRGPVLRTITSLSGRIRPGDSGGPAIDRNGRVETMMFASRVGTSGGYGVPPSDIQDALDGAHGSVSTGPCAR